MTRTSPIGSQSKALGAWEGSKQGKAKALLKVSAWLGGSAHECDYDPPGKVLEKV